MVTSLTLLQAKDLHFLQPNKSEAWAQKHFRKAKLALRSKFLNVSQLADYWGVDTEDVISQLAPRFLV